MGVRAPYRGNMQIMHHAAAFMSCPSHLSYYCILSSHTAFVARYGCETVASPCPPSCFSFSGCSLKIEILYLFWWAISDGRLQKQKRFRKMHVFRCINGRTQLQNNILVWYHRK